jgi:hypothetical protein
VFVVANYGAVLATTIFITGKQAFSAWAGQMGTTLGAFTMDSHIGSLLL